MSVLDVLFGKSYTNIGKAISSGDISMKALKAAYTKQRRLAVDRYRKISKPEITAKYGVQEEQHFTKLQNLRTTSDIVHALVDVNRFLYGGKSTASQLEQRKQKYIEVAQEHGFSVDESNYLKWFEFMKWFNASEWKGKFDSESEEVEEAFEAGNSPEDWDKLLSAFSGYEDSES